MYNMHHYSYVTEVQQHGASPLVPAAVPVPSAIPRTQDVACASLALSRG